MGLLADVLGMAQTQRSSIDDDDDDDDLYRCYIGVRVSVLWSEAELLKVEGVGK